VLEEGEEDGVVEEHDILEEDNVFEGVEEDILEEDDVLE